MDGRVYLEQVCSRSWVDPVGAVQLSTRLSKLLKSKFDCIRSRGNQLWFITLTYDPKRWGIEDWASSSEAERAAAGERLWDSMTADRHVSRFVERWSLASGLEVKGRWWSKREFTERGLIHHHLLFEGPHRFDYRTLLDAWGWGRMDCQPARSDEALSWYVGKYCTKTGHAPPAWVYERDPGTLRFTTCADGWWSELEKDVESLPRSVRDRLGLRERERRELDAYECRESIGARVKRLAQTVRVRGAGLVQEIDGISLGAFRLLRDREWWESHLAKVRRTMDEVAGAAFGQVVAEIREARRVLVDDPEALLRATVERLQRSVDERWERAAFALEGSGRESPCLGMPVNRPTESQASIWGEEVTLSSSQQCARGEGENELGADGFSVPCWGSGVEVGPKLVAMS